MENFEYHVPVYIPTAGIATSGHCSDLANAQVGLFDRSTFSVATSTGLGKEFFFAQGTIGGRDWYGGKMTQVSHKSPFFYGKDVTNMYLSMPQTIQNEEWVLGFNGSPSSKGLSYEAGKAIRVQFYFHGNPTYRFWSGPKTFVVSYTPPVDCSEPCSGNDCPEPIADCLVHTQALINEINNHVELKKFGVQAKLVNDPFNKVSPNMEKFQLEVCDNGDSVSLNRVRSQYPTKNITRIGRVGSVSVYEFCQPDGTDPVAFAQSGSILQAVCGDCPVGSTLTEAKDVYHIHRPLAGTESLIDAAARDTYADTVGTSYDAGATDAEKTFVGQNGSTATVEIKITAGDAALVAKLADTVEFVRTEPAVCTFAAPTAIAWVASGVGISSTRTLRINGLNRPDCDANGDRIADLTAILAGVKGINLGSITLVEGIGCVDDYTVTQTSDDCLPEDCLTNNVTFTYEDLPAFENRSWEVVPATVIENTDRQCGIRVTAGYIDPKFGNCSFSPTDYYETEPVKMEVSLLQEDGSNCDFASLPSVHQSKIGRIARQSGEYILREVVMKTNAYQKHMQQFSMDARAREVFDMNLLDMVDRTAFYKLYYVTYSASYGASFRKNEQEKFTTIFAFKEDDPAALAFEANVISTLTAKSGVTMHVNV